MHAIFRVTTGNREGQKILLRQGQSVSVGQSDLNDFAFPDDVRMSREHFVIEFMAGRIQLKSLSKSNTTKNGHPVGGQAEVQDGDEIVAGQTCFQVSLHDAITSSSLVVDEPSVKQDRESDISLAAVKIDPSTEAADASLDADSLSLPTVSPSMSMPANAQPIDSGDALQSAPPFVPLNSDEPFPLNPTQQAVLDRLSSLPDPLYAIIDAARDPLVLSLLTLAEDHEFQSLFQGTKVESVAEVGPFLVRLPPTSNLLRKFVGMGWGNSWGIYLATQETTESLCEHFRQFILVETDEGKEVFFRFYDPRVFRVFLPTSTRKEAKRLFGPIESFHLEDENPENVMEFQAEKNGKSQVTALAVGQATESTVSS